MNSKAIKRQLLAAIAMVLVAAIALGSSTYAWFANSDMVTATGLKATAQSGASALLIAENKTGVTDKNFSTAVELTTPAKALSPVSTIDGETFYYTAPNNVTADGDAIADNYTLYSAGAFGTDETSPVGYVEYDLLLKAALSEEKPINLTQLDLEYTQKNSETDNENAFRVAFFVSEKKTSCEAAKSADVSLVSIMGSQHGSQNFSSSVENDEVVKDSEGVPVYHAVSGTNTLAAVQNPRKAARVASTVPANEDAYYRVIVRLWIEGEDITCTNTVFNPLAGTWACSLKFETNVEHDPVRNYTATGHQPGSGKV